MTEHPSIQGAKAGKKLADLMIKVKIKSWYPPFIVGWLVGRAIKRDLKQNKKDRKSNYKVHKKGLKHMNILMKELESKAWRYEE